jgi:hypothetical protein
VTGAVVGVAGDYRRKLTADFGTQARCVHFKPSSNLCLIKCNFFQLYLLICEIASQSVGSYLKTNKQTKPSSTLATQNSSIDQMQPLSNPQAAMESTLSEVPAGWDSEIVGSQGQVEGALNASG